MMNTSTDNAVKLQTKEQFKAEIARWVAVMKVKPVQIRVQRMKKKWASCSSRGLGSVPKICHCPRTPPSTGAQPRQAIQKSNERLFVGVGSYFGGTKRKIFEKHLILRNSLVIGAMEPPGGLLVFLINYKYLC
jgi:hypothetical protein